MQFQFTQTMSACSRGWTRYIALAQRSSRQHWPARGEPPRRLLELKRHRVPVGGVRLAQQMLLSHVWRHIEQDIKLLTARCVGTPSGRASAARAQRKRCTDTSLYRSLHTISHINHKVFGHWWPPVPIHVHRCMNGILRTERNAKLHVDVHDVITVPVLGYCMITGYN